MESRADFWKTNFFDEKVGEAVKNNHIYVRFHCFFTTTSTFSSKKFSFSKIHLWSRVMKVLFLQDFLQKWKKIAWARISRVTNVHTSIFRFPFILRISVPDFRPFGSQTCSHPMVSWFVGLVVFWCYQVVPGGSLGLTWYPQGPWTTYRYTPWGTRKTSIPARSGSYCRTP